MFVLLAFHGIAQESISVEKAQDFFNEVAQNYTKNYFYYKIRMTSYKGYTSTTKEDESEGYFIKKGNTVISYQLGIYSVQDKSIKVMIDSSENMVGITYPDTALDLNYSMKGLLDKRQYIQSIDFMDKREKKYITINFKKGFSYSKIVTVLSKNNLLESVEMFIARDVHYKDVEGNEQNDKARIKIVYYPMKGKKEIPLNIENILTKQNSEYITTSAFSKFELIDFRYEK